MITTQVIKIGLACFVFNHFLIINYHK
jgi:hypothetical protein